MKVFCLDTETTAGQRNGRVVQFAIVDDNYRGEWLINPQTYIQPGCISVHKITPDMVADKPTFFESEGYDELRNRLNNNEVMIAHHAPFDIAILCNEGVHIHKYVDTCKVARKILKSDGVSRFGLQFLKDYLDLPGKNPGDTLTGYAHSALYDTIVLYWLYKYLYQKIKDLYPGEDPNQVMLEITMDTQKMTRFRFGKYRGKSVKDVAEKDIGYIKWLYKSEMKNPPPKRKKSLIDALGEFIT